MLAATTGEVNQRHMTFWASEAEQLQRRLRMPELVVVATKLIDDECARCLPGKHCSSFGIALRNAEDLCKTFGELPRKMYARKAGSAPKGDPLTKLIREIVIRNPDVTEPELRSALEAEKVHGVVVDISGDTLWFNRSVNMVREIPLSALKGRLERAKSLVRSKSR